MIRYFRINDPYRLVGLFLLLLLIYIPLFITTNDPTIPELKSLIVGEKQNEDYEMYAEVVDNTAPLAAWSHEMLDTLFGRSILIRHILAFVIIFLQSAYLGIMFISKKVFSENTYIPSLLFSLLFFFSYDNLALSNELLGSGFLLLALNNLFQEIEFRNERDESIFNVGLCISLASLFAFSFVVYLFCAIVILSLFTRSTVRKFLLLVFGFLLPHLLTISLAYLNNSASALWQYFYLSNLAFDRMVFTDAKTILTLSAIPIIYFTVSLVILNREARFSKYQSQILQAVFLWLAFSLIFTLYTKDLRPQSFTVFIPGLAFLLTHFFLLIRRKKFVEMNSWILFAGIVGVAYLARFDHIRSVSYRTLMVPGISEGLNDKRILVLDNTVELYNNNYLATPFFNWNLSEEIFRNPDYYENVTMVYHAFKTDPPQVVIDREDLLKGFFQRMPDIQNEYTRRGDQYIRKINN